MSAKRKPINRMDTFAERLDAAVMQAFPNVECCTEFSILAMRYVTEWTAKGSITPDCPGGKKLPAALAKQVKAFVQGFSAAEEYTP